MSIDPANGGAGLALSAFGSTGPSGKRCHMLTDGGNLRVCVGGGGGGGGGGECMCMSFAYMLQCLTSKGFHALV